MLLYFVLESETAVIDLKKKPQLLYTWDCSHRPKKKPSYYMLETAVTDLKLVIVNTNNTKKTWSWTSKYNNSTSIVFQF